MPTCDTLNDLRERYPGGHPEFLGLALKEIELHSKKNHDYASGGKPTGNFDRVAAILALYPKLSLADPRVVAMVYTLKQLDAVLWGLSENIEHQVEGLNERLQDISVYSKIVMCMNLDRATATTDQRETVCLDCGRSIADFPSLDCYTQWQHALQFESPHITGAAR